jgi:hypothetical protein
METIDTLADGIRHLAAQVARPMSDELVDACLPVLRCLAGLCEQDPEAQNARRLLFSAAVLAFNAARFKEAITIGRGTLDLFPACPDIIMVLGYTAKWTGDPVLAITLLMRGIRITPNADSLHFQAGHLCLSMFEEAADAGWTGDFDRAEDLCRGLLRALPAYPPGAALLERIPDMRGRPAGSGQYHLAKLRSLHQAFAGGYRRPVWVVVIGAIRDHDEFAHIIKWLGQIRAARVIDGVVLSTWKGHVSQRPDYVRELERSGIVWVEDDEPNVQIKWNTVQQMVALRNGLQLCPTDCFIVKSRTDKISDSLHERFMFEIITHREKEFMSCDGDILDRRIAVTSGSIFAPFHLKDFIFCGLRKDIEKCVNFDIRYLIQYKSMSTEQWIYSKPFMEQFPIFDTYFRVFPGHPHGTTLNRKWMTALLEQDFYLDVFLCHLTVLSKYFRIGRHGENKECYDAAVPLLGEIPAGAALHNIGLMTGEAVALQDYWIPALLQGGFQPDSFARRISARLECIGSAGFQQRYGRPESLARPEVQAFTAVAARLLSEIGSHEEVWVSTPDPVRLPDYWQRV